jgi:hypothetical protein
MTFKLSAILQLKKIKEISKGKFRREIQWEIFREFLLKTHTKEEFLL